MEGVWLDRRVMSAGGVGLDGGVGSDGGVGLSGGVGSYGVVRLAERIGSDRRVGSMKIESAGGFGPGQRF